MRERTEKLTIQAFRAVDHREHVIRYIVEHHRVLEDIGVTSALKMDYGWCMDPRTVVVVALHEELGMVGGCRLEFAHAQRKLPIYQHLRPLEPELDTKLGDLVGAHGAELAGLWVAHRFSGNGIPWYLTAAAVSVLDRIEVGDVLCFAAEYTRKYAMQNGFEALTTIGDGGRVDFPIPGISSYALVNRNAGSLAKAMATEKDRLLSLRREPEQVRLESTYERPLEVTYRLHMDRKMTPLIPLHANLQAPGMLRRRSA